MESKLGHVAKSRFTLKIISDQLDPARLDDALELKHTGMVRKGDIIGRLPEIRVRFDEWIYSVDLYHPQETDLELDSILDHLIAHKKALDSLTDCEKILNLSVESDTMRMSYQLMPETLERLHRLGMPLEVSSVSWGEFRI